MIAHRLGTAALIFTMTGSLGCEPIGPEAHPPGVIRYPSALVVDPSGDFAYVANTNFDSRYAGGTITAVDLQTGRVSSGASVGTYSYGSDFAARTNDAGRIDRLYLTSREGSALTWVEVGTGVTPTLRCSDGAAVGGTSFHECEGRFLFGGAGANQDLGADPFGVEVLKRGDSTHLITSAFGGELNLFRLDEAGAPEHIALAYGNSGTYGLASHPVRGVAFTSSKFTNTLQEVLAYDDGSPNASLLVREAAIVSSPVTGREFGRSLAFAPSGDMAFLAYRGPPAGLVALDTRVLPDGTSRNVVIGVAGLPEGPTGVGVIEHQGRLLVAVSLFSRDEVAIVDGHSLDLLALVDVGDGPFDVAITKAGTKSSDPDAPVAVVGLFNEGALSVIDVDPTSTSFATELRRIR